MGKKHLSKKREEEEEEEMEEMEEEEFEQELRALREIQEGKGEEEKPLDPKEKERLLQNQKKEMIARVKEMNPSKVPWIERLDIASSKPVVIENIDDDFKRELAFYEQAMEAVVLGKQRVLQAGVSFERPDDYFAEMVKSDEHMMKIRQSLIEETQKVKRSEDAAKTRMMKKYAKQVQTEKLQERAKQKTATLEKIKLLRKGKKNLDDLKDDDFNVSVDDGMKESKKPASKPTYQKNKQEPREKSMKRQRKDDKFGFGGKKRWSKSNTAESTDHFGKFAKKTKTGLPPKSSHGKVSKQRPGKARRSNQRGKGGK